MPARGGWGHASPENFMIFDLLRLFLVYTLGVKPQKVGQPTTKPSCCIWSPQNQRRDSASGRRGCIAASYPRKARESKRSNTDSISPSLAAEGALHE